MNHPRTPLAVSASLCVLFGLAGCSSSRSVSMSTMNPAEMTFPSEIRTILIVDRSEFSDGTVGLLESVLTGEILDQDRAGLQTMISELRDQLAWSGRFHTLVAHEVLPGNSLTGVFPAPLEWEKIDSLVRKYGADVVLSIEIFDSDFLMTNGRRLVDKEVKQGGGEAKVQVTEYFAEGVANMTIGIRIYDPNTRNILDEDLFSRTNRWEAQGSSLQDALIALDDKVDAAKRVSRQVAIDYAYKIAPMPVQVRRTFYGRSKNVPEMEMGGRQADVGDWAGAARTWESGLSAAGAKDAGRLSYNIAIAYEVLGDWKNARKWAERAYVEYGNKDARGYLNDLDRRVWREELAVDQMK